MFGNMSHAGIVLAGSAESDGENFVVVLRFYIKHLSTALGMSEFIASSLNIRQCRHLIHCKAVECIACL